MKKKSMIAIALMIVTSFFISKGVYASDTAGSTSDHIESAVIGDITFDQGNNLLDVGAAGSTDYVSTVSLAADRLRTQIMDRQAVCTVYYKADASSYDSDKFSKLAEQIYESAIKHTGISDQGDYLRWGAIASVNISGKTTSQGLVITYALKYYTTENQELKLQEKLTEITKELNLDGRSDYEKVVAIYNYICDHVAYDYEHDADDSYGLKRTVYGAIFNGKANCQGYAVLFYRMALAEGIDCRIIGGYGKNRSHGWNIVKLDNYYYYVDATWDAEQGARTYFLKGQNNFPDHTPDTEYKGYDFTNQYPVDTKDYKPDSTSGSCGKNLQWKLSEDHVLTITGTGYMYTYSESVPAPWDYVKEDIKKIVLGSSVQFIGEYAFANCTEVKEVTLGSTLFKIGQSAFKNCSKLEKIDFPKRLAVIQSKAFYGCKQLTRFTFSGEYPTIESDAFYKVSATAYYPYSDSTWEPIISTPTSHQFGGFISWKVWSGNLEDDPEAKSGTCGNGVTWELQTDLLKINGRGTMNDWTDPMACPWYNYRKMIKNISIGSEVKNIGQNAFSNITNLSKIDIPEKITSIGEKAFDQCTSLKKVEFKGSLPTISSDAFNGVSTEGYYPLNANSTWDKVKNDPKKYQYGGKIVWKKHIYFVLKKHNNSFNHSTDNFVADYSTDYADKLLARAKKKSEKERLEKKIKEKWEGSCFGIETSMIQNKRNRLGYNKDFYFLDKPINDSKLLNIINYYQLTQYLDAFSPTAKTQKGNSKSTSLKTFLESLVAQVKKDEKNEDLSIFDYFYNIDGKGANSGHAVILCGYEYGDFDYDGKKEHRLQIYDCNHYDHSEYDYIYVSDDYTSFTYTSPIRDDIRLENCYTELNYVSSDDISTKDYYNLGLSPFDDIIINPVPGIDNIVGSAGTTTSQNTITLNVYADEPFTMVNAKGEILRYNGRTIYGTMNVYDYRMVGSQNPEIYITVDPSNYFSVSGTKDRFYFGAEIDGHYYAAKADGASQVILSKKNGVELKGNNLFTFEVTKGTDFENSDLISVSGTAQADVCLNNDGDKVRFTSDKDCSDLKVETYKDTDKKEQSIQQKANSVTFTDDQDDTIKIDTEKKKINACQISLRTSESYIYDGKEKRPEVIVKDEDSKQLTLSKDYTISYSDNVNAGEGKITITGIGNYEGQAVQKFSIEKAEQNFVSEKQNYNLYVNDMETIQIKNAIGTIRFSSRNPEIVSVDSKGNIKGLRKGSTVIYVTADGVDQSGKQNYRSCQKEIEVIVKEKSSDNGPKKEDTSEPKENMQPSQSTSSKYDQTKRTYDPIRLSAPSIKKVQSKKKGKLQIKWTKRAKVDGYQIQCSTKKNFKKNKKTVLVKKNVTSVQMKKLKRKKRYYVRIRSYKQVFSNRYYSNWSKVKTIKIK